MSTVDGNLENSDGIPAGQILTTVRTARSVVLLRGEVDLCLAAQFEELLNTLPTTTAELVLDVEGLTFCDSTLATFIDGMLQHVPITVAHTNRWVREYLSVVRLDDRVRMIDGAI